MIAIDANILVYAHRAALPEHRTARRAIERAVDAGAWGIAFLRALVDDGGAQLWLPAAGFGERFLEVAAAAGVRRAPRLRPADRARRARERGA